MKFGFWNFYNFYNANRMFTQAKSLVGDDLAYPTFLLGQRLREMGHSAATLDMEPLDSCDKIFFIDYPTRVFNARFRALLRSKHPNLNLLASEPPIVRPDNYSASTHALFRKVMTWKKDVAARDASKFALYHLPNKYR